MPEGFLPPVVAELGANTAEFLSGFEAAIGSLRQFGAAVEEVGALVSESLALASRAAIEMQAVVVESSEGAKTALRQVASAARALNKAVAGMGDSIPTAMGAVSASTEEMASTSRAAFVTVTQEAQAAAASMGEVGTAAAAMAGTTTAASTAAAKGSKEAGAAATAGAAETETAMGRVGTAATAATAGAAAGLKKYALGLAGVSLGVLATVHSASDFQAEMVRLRTSAGETGEVLGGKLTGNLKLVSDGVLKMAVDTGTSTKELAEGLYKVESAGFHGAEGLKLLESAAEGARAEGASLETVSNTLDSAMNSFGFNIDHVNGVMNAMVQTTSRGKASMGELSSALPVVMSKASAAGVSLQEMLGAMATMTAQGVTARQAAQNLQATISHLADQKEPARKAFASIGLDAQDLAAHLGQRGLTGTFDMVSKAITEHMGKDGLVVVKAMNDSKQATASLKAMMDAMGPAAKDLSQRFLDGSISLGEYSKQAKALPGLQGNMATQFLALARNAEGFDSMLKNGSGPAQTYISMLSKMMGGSAGLNTYLELSGVHAKTFAENVDAIGKAAADNAEHVEGFNQVQQTFGFRLSQVKEAAVTLGIQIGTSLLPYLEKFATILGRGISWLAQSKAGVEALAVAVGGVLVGAIVALGTATYAAAGPEILIATAIIGVGTAVIYTYQHIKILHTLVDGLGRLIGGAFSLAWSVASAVARRFGEVVMPIVRRAVEAVFNWFDEHREQFRAAWDAVLRAVHTVVSWFKDTVMPLLRDGIKWVFDWFDSHKEGFRIAWQVLAHEVHDIVQWVNDNVLDWLKGKIHGLVQWWQDHGDLMKAAWKQTWDSIELALKISWDLIKGTLHALMQVWSATWSVISGIAQVAWDIIKGVIRVAVHDVEGIIDISLDLIRGHWGKAWRDFTGLVSQTWEDVKTYLRQTTADLDTLLYSAGQNLIKGFIGGIKSMIGAVKNAVGDVTGSIVGFFNHSPAKEGPLSGAGGPDISGATFGRMLSDGLLSSIPTVTAASAQVAKAVALGNGTYVGAGTTLPTPRLVPPPPAAVGAAQAQTLEVHYHAHVTVQGSVLTDRDLRTVVEQAMLRQGAANSLTWNNYSRH